MTRWNRFKHWVGFHGEAEWLDGRIFVDGTFLRTYYCHKCDLLFYEGNTKFNARQFRLSYLQLVAERDAEREKMRKVLSL